MRKSEYTNIIFRITHNNRANKFSQRKKTILHSKMNGCNGHYTTEIALVIFKMPQLYIFVERSSVVRGKRHTCNPKKFYLI